MADREKDRYQETPQTKRSDIGAKIETAFHEYPGKHEGGRKTRGQADQHGVAVPTRGFPDPSAGLAYVVICG